MFWTDRWAGRQRAVKRKAILVKTLNHTYGFFGTGKFHLCLHIILVHENLALR